jgi:hypothetical protein
MKKTTLHQILILGLVFTLSSGRVFSESNDKNQYTLFNPTPRDQMREMLTDRPDTTESPVTVDAGHFQFEGNFLSGSYNKDNSITDQGFGVMVSNVKFGLLNNIDIQFVFTPYEYASSKFQGEKTSSEGWSDDTQIRLKINLWGNEGEDTALALMPYITAPTGNNGLSNDHVEGGLIIPYAVALPNDFSLGLMAEADVVYLDETDSYQVDFLHTATVGHDIVGNLAGYIEYIGVSSDSLQGIYQSRASGGLTYAVSDDWILDMGGTLGLSKETDDVTYFIGTSFRS